MQMYGKQASILRLVISFLIAFIVFGGVGYALYRYIPRWWRYLFGKGDKTFPVDRRSYSYDSYSVTEPNRKPRRHRRGIVLERHLVLEDQEEAVELDQAKGLETKTLHKRSHKERKKHRSSNFLDKFAKRFKDNRFSEPLKSKKRDHRRKPGSSKTSLSIGEYSDDDSELKGLLALFHADVRKLFSHYGANVGKEYFGSLQYFWEDIREQEDARITKVKALRTKAERVPGMLKKLKDLNLTVTTLKGNEKELKNRLATMKTQLTDCQNRRQRQERVNVRKLKKMKAEKEKALEEMKETFDEDLKKITNAHDKDKKNVDISYSSDSDSDLNQKIPQVEESVDNSYISNSNQKSVKRTPRKKVTFIESVKSNDKDEIEDTLHFSNTDPEPILKTPLKKSTLPMLIDTSGKNKENVEDSYDFKSDPKLDKKKSVQKSAKKLAKKSVKKNSRKKLTLKESVDSYDEDKKSVDSHSSSESDPELDQKPVQKKPRKTSHHKRKALGKSPVIPIIRRIPKDSPFYIPMSPIKRPHHQRMSLLKIPLILMIKIRRV